MPTTTEILVCPLSAGSDIGDQQNEAAKVLKEVGGTLKTTDGVQQIQFGTTVEKPDVFELHVGKFTSSLRLEQVPHTMYLKKNTHTPLQRTSKWNDLPCSPDWNSLSHHKTFMATEAYQPFLNRFLTIAGGAPSMLHVDFEPAGGYTKATSAPVTEVATFYFGSKEAPADYLEGARKFAEIFENEKTAGFLGAALGLSHEDNLKSPKEGLEGRAAVLVIGWESVDAHMKVRETQLFKDNIHLLRNGVKDAEVHHVQLMNFVE